MTIFGDYVRRNGVVGTAEASLIRRRAIESGSEISIIDPVLDETWARVAKDAGKKELYFDYYFSGQDIKVRVAEIPEEDTNFGTLPIIELAFNIEQEKQPVYGFWSYTYDTVMRGTRLVSGAFTIATRYPTYMKDLLGQAAKNRAGKEKLLDGYRYHKGLTDDDSKIEQYWQRNIDPAVRRAGNHVFSVHPPFSMVVVHGIQSISAPQEASTAYRDYYVTEYSSAQNVIMTDENHRLVEASPDYQDRLIIDAIELKSCQRAYTPDGSVCVETYSFFARDVVEPTPGSTELPGASFIETPNP